MVRTARHTPMHKIELILTPFAHFTLLRSFVPTHLAIKSPLATCRLCSPALPNAAFQAFPGHIAYAYYGCPKCHRNALHCAPFCLVRLSGRPSILALATTLHFVRTSLHF